MVRYHVQSHIPYHMKTGQSPPTRRSNPCRLTMSTNKPESMDTGRKDDNDRSADNLPFLDDSQTDQIEEQHDKRVCSACCDSLSIKSTSATSNNTIVVSSNTDHHPASSEATFIAAHSSSGHSSSVTVEYLTLHPPDEDEEIPLEISAVAVDLPDNINNNTPPPPYIYTLIRGRRMRFLSQRMRLPADGQRYLTDLYQQQQDHNQQASGAEEGKGCCSTVLLPESLNVRWFIIIISFIALCCVVVGIVLGALKGANEFTGDDSLTVALLLIGVGIILMAVSGAAWKLTAKQGAATSLRTMLGFGSVRATSPPLRSFRRASTGAFSAYLLRNSFGRGCSGHYHEFQFRPPPPSYHASISECNYSRSRTAHEATGGGFYNRTPPPIYRARADPVNANPLPLLNQLTIISMNDYQTQQRPAPPSYRFRPAVLPNERLEPPPGRERASLGQTNATFNDESHQTAHDAFMVPIHEQPNTDRRTSVLATGDIVDGQLTPARRRPVDPLSTPKSSHNCNMELLAQL